MKASSFRPGLFTVCRNEGSDGAAGLGLGAFLPLKSGGCFAYPAVYGRDKNMGISGSFQ